MRRATVVLSLVGLLLSMVACGSGDPSDDAPGVQPPIVSPSIEPAPSATPTSATPTAAPSRSLPVGPAGTPPPAGSGDVPGPLPWGGRTLTGVVERSGDCTMLLVGGRRWALTGEAAATLSPGERVTVQGSLTTRPAACADRDLAQTVAVARVDPA
jgi:hypothetical protein